jgi:hypothetical protein
VAHSLSLARVAGMCFTEPIWADETGLSLPRQSSPQLTWRATAAACVRRDTCSPGSGGRKDTTAANISCLTIPQLA